jgi:hypothetical protein
LGSVFAARGQSALKSDGVADAGRVAGSLAGAQAPALLHRIPAAEACGGQTSRLT